MTSEAWRSLVDEVARLRQDVAEAAGRGLEEGIGHAVVAQLSRRLMTLTAALDAADVVPDDGSAVIGRRATLRESDGQASTYAIVFPGDGDPTEGWISADSPLGLALIGARAGDVVEVGAPAGRWSVSVERVD
jgi:transcription elongation factor GreA